MPYFRSTDVRLYYDELGSGPPLVLLHGFFASGQAWRELAPRLAERYRVIVPDLRGHGRSEGAPETLHHARFAADLIALLDHLGLERAHLVGHSSGGMALLFVGTRHPERVWTLALVNATYTFDARARAEMIRNVEELPSHERAIARARQLHAPERGPDYWRVLAEVFRSYTADPAELPFTLADLRAIPSPTLILHGDRDPFFPPDVPLAMYQAMPNAELAIAPSCGHFLPRERPEFFLQVVQDFLRRQAGHLR